MRSVYICGSVGSMSVPSGAVDAGKLRQCMSPLLDAMVLFLHHIMWDVSRFMRINVLVRKVPVPSLTVNSQ